MSIHLGGVTIDCADPAKLAGFWTEALGAKIIQDYGGEFIFIAADADSRPYVGLQRVPEKRAGKNRVHIDLAAADREAEVQRLVGLGATAVTEHSVPGLTWTVMQDPEGNEFCVGGANP
ncbi:MAG TPA: VOC family protein [Actinophytocola sp.]|uniref:VOC family protein n=1 Tax=Actinophytocola sp. TaxID=1872138 RepID=UPI002DBA5F41|nr:VOC family protein [Actinophytocola sp.]HEU5475000.1 VOC family protein [Actinophytocola sp.]